MDQDSCLRREKVAYFLHVNVWLNNKFCSVSTLDLLFLHSAVYLFFEQLKPFLKYLNVFSCI